MDVSQFTGVLVTRGNVDVEEILLSWPFERGIIWDNSRTDRDLAVYGRYAALGEVETPYVFTQDDDCIVLVEELCASYSGEGLLVNVPPGENPWLAWGACFPRLLPQAAFEFYWQEYPEDRFFHRWADVAFAHAMDWEAIDLGHRDLPWATAPDRMYREPPHYVEQAQMRDRINALLEVA